jgi:hypothetical protein
VPNGSSLGEAARSRIRGLYGYLDGACARAVRDESCDGRLGALVPRADLVAPGAGRLRPVLDGGGSA